MQTLTSGQQTLVDEFHALVAGTSPQDRHEIFPRLREELPIFRSDKLDAWVVSRHRDVKQVLNIGDVFQPPQAGAGASAFGRSFMQMSGREHSKKIGIVAREMRTARAMRERLTGLVQEIAVRQAEALPMGQPINLREQYATWVPLLAITALTDLPEAARFRDWYRTIVAGGSSSIANPGAREAAFQPREEVRLFLEPIIEQRRRAPGKDLLSDLVTAEYDDAPIPHEEIVSNVIFLLAAGVETTERVLTSVLRHMALEPDQWAWLKANYRDPDALASFSAEALRLYPPVSAFVRAVLADTELAGQPVRAGDKVVSISASGNCDDSHFADPMRFDPTRFLANSERQFAVGGDILSFGDGMHHCVGSRLAKVEMAHAFSEFLDRVARIEPVGSLPPGEGFIFNSPPTLPVILHPV
jgi:cytochrome P450